MVRVTWGVWWTRSWSRRSICTLEEDLCITLTTRLHTWVTCPLLRSTLVMRHWPHALLTHHSISGCRSCWCFKWETIIEYLLWRNVLYFIILQAALFYIPRKLWKSNEGGLMNTFGKTGINNFLSRGDSDHDHLDSGSVEDDVRKQSIYFLNILHHNTGYFLTVTKCFSWLTSQSFYYSLSCVSFWICWLWSAIFTWQTSFSREDLWSESATLFFIQTNEVKLNWILGTEHRSSIISARTRSPDLINLILSALSFQLLPGA